MANPHIYALTDTWNNGATAFNAIKMDVTNTASDAASRLLSLQVSSSAKFDVTPDGQVLVPAGSAANPAYAHIGALNYGWFKDANSYCLSTNGTVYVRFNYNNFSELLLTSDGVFGFTNGTTTGTRDTSFHRLAAGVAEVRKADGSTGTIKAHLRVHANAASETVVCTHTILMEGADGTVYKVPCVPA